MVLYCAQWEPPPKVENTSVKKNLKAGKTPNRAQKNRREGRSF
ncbi:krab zinc finger protein [Roseibium sp. TrichSKD4]|nr:krab zinc finger protein [Roseibium sp. TrichSKD4]